MTPRWNSPELHEEARQLACGCGAQSGEWCISLITGKRMNGRTHTSRRRKTKFYEQWLKEREMDVKK
jgi:hypothetical protein